MTLLRPLRWLILIVSCFAILGFTSAENLGGWSVLLLLLCAAGWAMTEGRLGSAVDAADFERMRGESTPRSTLANGLPRLAVNVLLLAAVPWAIWRARAGESPVSAFLSLLAVVLVLKLWERRDRSDYGQILTMAVFLTIGSTLNDNSFFIGLLLVLQIPLVLLATMLLHTLTPILIERATLQQQPKATREPALKPARSRNALRALTGMAVLLLLAGAPIVVGIFTSIPRSNISALLGNFGAVRRTSGLSNSVNLNAGGIISQSREVIARVSMRDSAGRPYGGVEFPQYLRAIALQYYKDGTWTSARTWDFPVVLRDDGDANLYRSRFAKGNTITQQVTVLSGSTQDLFSLAFPISLRATPGIILHENKTTGMVVVGTPTGPMSYEITSDPDAHLPTPLLKDSAPLTFPEPGVQPIATEILTRAGIDPDPKTRKQEDNPLAVRALETFLQTQFEYSLDTPRPAGGEVITWFLTTRPPAHCEFFASALAAMCRSVGIDARVIAGYMTSEYDPDRNEYSVRSSDAHAWVEAEIMPGRWQTYDGTPTSSEEFVATRQGGMFDTFSRWLRGAESIWNRSVVSFDQKRQTEMWGTADWIRRIGPQAPAANDITEWRRQLATTSKWALRIAVSAVVVAGLFFLLTKFIRRVLPSHALLGAHTAFDDDPAARKLYAQVLATCAALGAPKPSAVPLREHMQQHPSLMQHPALIESAELLYVRAFAVPQGEHSAATFGSDVKRLAATLQQLRKTAREPRLSPSK
jgi:hypothetical protein